MYIEHIDTTERIDYVIIYILATLQRVKVSLATLLSTFYFYFASDYQKCINLCKNCRKLKSIHYYSCNFRLFMLHYKHNFICMAFPKNKPCIYSDKPLPFSLITNTGTQFLGGNLFRNLLCILQMCNIEWFEQYSINYLNRI